MWYKLESHVVGLGDTTIIGGAALGLWLNGRRGGCIHRKL